MAEPTFYEEDGEEIMQAVTYMMEHKAVPRMDIDLEGSKSAKVYWADSVLWISIIGLRELEPEVVT